MLRISLYIDSIFDDPQEVVIAISRTMNGGIEQESTKINFSDYDSTTGVPTLSATQPSNAIAAFHDPVCGDVIGKLLIKCTEAFDDSSTYFSIGTATNNEYYAKIFPAPSAETVSALVDFRIGLGMYDKVEYIN